MFKDELLEYLRDHAGPALIGTALYLSFVAIMVYAMVGGM